ncbi:hypothetical protein BBP40_000557 [Aspergillus hancockii]|nr:hypothetical protein BBP40_000557 [Aspergillus hancockii]
MVANDDVLRELIGLVITGGEALSNKIFVDSSTVHPDTINRLSSNLSCYGAVLLSAPVFGGPAFAMTGSLVFAIGGLNQHVRMSSHILLEVTFITLSLMEAVGEAQVFAEKTGLGTGAMEELNH